MPSPTAHQRESAGANRPTVLMRCWPLTPLLFCSLLGAQEPEVPRNAFAGVETIVLQNGLKIWFKHLPDEPNAAANVAVVGSDQDPAR